MPAQDLPAMAVMDDELYARITRLHDGALAEQRHLLYDQDPDSAVPAFPYPDDISRRLS
ncbi:MULTISPECIES: hypothetical protein [unclassified Streptomyces]|uniref:hypothetical protein n=1 Tax=unclassified Streptomyces TaxID=2593676 RepID=UPI00081F36A8|nr:MULTISPECIES: hypothetical protein [unclassified Streptomyces]MYR28641.1 hypothetical protein [Streptomyces sp. SID4945]SCF39936.1 hypothetical protein GA0115257_115410 [Streptomyces sp. LcepLS]